VLRTPGLGPAALLGKLLLALEQVVELLVVEILELLGEPAAVLHPLARGFFQGAGDVQQSPVTAVADREVQGAVQLAVPATAGGLATGAAPLNEGAAQEG
jgi:hypothetical protein